MVPEAFLKCPGMQAWGVRREIGEVLAGSHKPQQWEEGAGGGVQAPRDCSGGEAVSSVLTLKAIQNKVCVLVSSDVTANH